MVISSGGRMVELIGQWSPTNDPVFKVLLQHYGASTLLHVELSCPVDVEDGWEVLRVAVEEILRRVAGHKLVTEFKNLRTDC